MPDFWSVGRRWSTAGRSQLQRARKTRDDWVRAFPHRDDLRNALPALEGKPPTEAWAAALRCTVEYVLKLAGDPHRHLSSGAETVFLASFLQCAPPQGAVEVPVETVALAVKVEMVRLELYRFGDTHLTSPTVPDPSRRVTPRMIVTGVTFLARRYQCRERTSMTLPLRALVEC